MIKVYKGQQIDRSQRWIHLTLTVDGDECRFNHVAPLGLFNEELREFAESREDSYRLDILKDMYPDADYKSSLGKDELAQFEEWIKDGCMNRDEDGKYIDKIEKVPWTGTHPPKTESLDREKISEQTRQQYMKALELEASATTNAQRVKALRTQIRVLQDIIFGRRKT